MEVAASRKKPTRPKRPPGQPSKLTPKMMSRIEELITAGCSMRETATVVGLDYSTVMKWMRRGREAKSGDYFQFFHRVTRARERCTASLTEFIQNAAPQDWRAAAWMLERRAPKRWTKTQSVEVSGRGGGPIDIRQAPDLSSLSAEELDQLERLLEKVPDAGRGPGREGQA